jgi:hypothetical protein
MDKSNILVAIGAVTIIILIVMYMRKKTSCDIPKCDPPKCKDMTQDKIFNYYFASQEQKFPQSFKIKEKNTGLFIGLCSDNTTVCLNTNPLVFTIDNNVSNDDPIINYISYSKGTLNRLRVGNGKYLKHSSKTNNLIIDTYNQNENKNFLFEILQQPSNGFVTTTSGIKTYTMDNTSAHGVTITDGNIVSFTMQASNDDYIKAYSLWEVVPV